MLAFLGGITNWSHYSWKILIKYYKKINIADNVTLRQSGVFISHPLSTPQCVNVRRQTRQPATSIVGHHERSESWRMECNRTYGVVFVLNLSWERRSPPRGESFLSWYKKDLKKSSSRSCTSMNAWVRSVWNSRLQGKRSNSKPTIKIARSFAW